MAQVELNGVRKVYPNGFQAIHGIDVDIADGEFIVLVGPSGCGKSTLLRMVAGLETITEGEIRIGGRVVNNLEPADRDIAMVFQNYALYPHMTVFNNMAYGLRNRGVAKNEIARRVQKAAEISSNASRGSFPGASASASRWAAPSCGSPQPSCSTSRCRTSMPSCGSRCGWRSSGCSAASAPPAFT